MIGTAAALAATAAAVAYALRTLRDRRTPPPEAESAPAPSGPRGLKVGDVILHGADEAWLGGMLEANEEGRFVVRLFHAPGSPWVAQLDARAERIAYVEAIELADGAVPAELVRKGIRHHLERRAEVQLSRAGEDVPEGDAADYVCLTGSAGRVVLSFDIGEKRHAFAGEVIPRAMLEVLPGDD
ncbi:MAG: hypothetical protein AAF938_06355 [Myxococcota bacterium]